MVLASLASRLTPVALTTVFSKRDVTFRFFNWYR